MKDWRDGADGNALHEVWDGVVVANGWYDNPVWPRTKGLQELVELGLATHAQSYRGPGKYAGKVGRILCSFVTLKSHYSLSDA
jgi:cation diffusion facilitator CzcD-associated flavoprotein CzcO